MLCYSKDMATACQLESALRHPVPQDFIHGLWYSKNMAKYPPEKAVQHIRRMAQMFAGIPPENVMSVYDTERMSSLSNPNLFLIMTSTQKRVLSRACSLTLRTWSAVRL